MKTCSKCQKEKSLNEFSKSKATKDGLQYHCKECAKQFHKQYKRDNPEKIAEYKKSYNKQYQRDNRERLAEYQKQFQKQYRRDNRERLTEYNKQYCKYRRANDINFRLAAQLRCRTIAVLKGKSKSAATLELLGADIDFVRKHLESQFTDGMSWDNYGKWHVDHIRPCASFDLADPEQQRQCFHYSNLQPLWAEDNIRKGAKFLDFAK